MTDDDGKELTRAVELARQTYLEVLDATKHQDDKVNRFLVAIAFLTTGAITFLLKADVLHVRYILESGDRIPFIAIAAGGYLAGTSASVLLLLMALSSELKLPGRKSPLRAESVKLEDSLLYFQMIGSRPLDGWMGLWEREPQATEAQLRLNYLREAHNLSERARVKYGLTDEAAAIYIYAIQWLAMGLLLGVHVTQRPGGVSQPIDLAGWAFALMAIVLAAHPMLQLYNVYRHERSGSSVALRLAALRARKKAPSRISRLVADEARQGDNHRRMLRPLVQLIAVVPIYVSFCGAVAVSEGEGLQRSYASVASVAAVVMGIAIYDRIRYDGPRILATVVVVVGIALPWVAASAESWLGLVGAVVPAFLLSAFTAGRQIKQYRNAVASDSRKLIRDVQRSEPNQATTGRLWTRKSEKELREELNAWLDKREKKDGVDRSRIEDLDPDGEAWAADKVALRMFGPWERSHWPGPHA